MSVGWFKIIDLRRFLIGSRRWNLWTHVAKRKQTFNLFCHRNAIICNTNVLRMYEITRKKTSTFFDSIFRHFTFTFSATPNSPFSHIGQSEWLPLFTQFTLFFNLNPFRYLFYCVFVLKPICISPYSLHFPP